MTRPSKRPRSERLARLTELYGAAMAEDIVSGAEPPGPPKADEGAVNTPPSDRRDRALVILEARIGNVHREAERHVREAFEAYRLVATHR